ncbi:uncharacterized protein KQ657_004521 [Scheffersomyces spartinae]|uniref:P-type Ca(2+) transporter n=1 Tax=Scheffersomyces spartinae TaxID=45513 RepID=A0A9P8AIZ6_9ASCO|nr:uncharacterized protein KQ657_004521 [Scheffersomyces spartinae]KAG7194309.1 hypothetical protein KQ657_004521 [Scheffersomyces spartinae]
MANNEHSQGSDTLEVPNRSKLDIPLRTNINDNGGNISDVSSVSSDTPLQKGFYEICPRELSQLHDPKSIARLYNLGGLDHLVYDLLNSSTSHGIQDRDEENDIQPRKLQFGENVLPTRKPKSFIRLCWEAMHDKVLILLSIAAVISLALGLYETFGQGTVYDDEGLPLPKLDWVEGVAIITAVIIVVIVGAANDWQKERQFAKLNAKKEDREVVVIRNGSQKYISIFDLLVGDLINLQTGDVIPVDAILVSGEIECDESSITGESNTVRKWPAQDCLHHYERQLPTTEDLGSTEIKFKDPYMISGSKVLGGYGNAIATAVGPNSMHGRTMMALDVEAEVTPMQARLDALAEGISRYGFLAALILFVVLLIRYGVHIAPNGSFHDLPATEKGKKFIDILITAVTIVVVAVPEGLPLAVTLALAFATTRMAQNGNLVRVLKSCEIMGGATAICSDKTGTLTENKMRIVRAYFNKDFFFDSRSDALSTVTNLPGGLKDVIAANITLNSTAFENEKFDESIYNKAREKPKPKSLISTLISNIRGQQKAHSQTALGVESEPYLGNKTESALLIFARESMNLFKLQSLESIRTQNRPEIVQTIPFESSRKWAGIIVKLGPGKGFRFYIKGAAEIVFKQCGYETTTNHKLDRSDRERVLCKIDEYGIDALRAIMLAHRDFSHLKSWPPTEIADENNPREADPKLLFNASHSAFQERSLILDMLVGIQDPVKEDVPEAVLQCKKAGVSVRMVTGDNLRTAKSISKNCNILVAPDLDNEFACMEGPVFRELLLKERQRIVPNLKVLARSSPEDKRILVDTLRKLGEVVAVTGDGTNDAPALKLADVGFSMGIAGTEVAREASDIILMTDDFTDIVQAIKWGRTVATSIKKFIQFQLTVNITACVLTFVSAVASSDGHSVLTAVQLLWVNLIMDTLAALALATDKPDDSLLNRPPAGRTLPLISTSMWKMILGQSAMQLTVTFILHFKGPHFFFGNGAIDNHEQKQLDAMTFNAFVWLQFWKLVVTRKLDEADEITTIRGRITRENLDFFQHLLRNWYFIVITVLIGACQVLIMFVGGAAFSIARQTPGMWATAIICGFLSIPVGIIIRIIPNIWVERLFPTKAFNTFLYYAGLKFLLKKNRANRKNSDEEAGNKRENGEVEPGKAE